MRMPTHHAVGHRRLAYLSCYLLVVRLILAQTDPSCQVQTVIPYAGPSDGGTLVNFTRRHHRQCGRRQAHHSSAAFATRACARAPRARRGRRASDPPALPPPSAAAPTSWHRAAGARAPRACGCRRSAQASLPPRSTRLRAGRQSVWAVAAGYRVSGGWAWSGRGRMQEGRGRMRHGCRGDAPGNAAFSASESITSSCPASRRYEPARPPIPAVPEPPDLTSSYTGTW